MSSDSVNVDDTDNRSPKWKQEAGTFVDFKKLESPPDEDFDIDGEAFLH